jgi:hypothetical protein
VSNFSEDHYEILKINPNNNCYTREILWVINSNSESCSKKIKDIRWNSKCHQFWWCKRSLTHCFVAIYLFNKKLIFVFTFLVLTKLKVLISNLVAFANNFIDMDKKNLTTEIATTHPPSSQPCSLQLSIFLNVHCKIQVQSVNGTFREIEPHPLWTLPLQWVCTCPHNPCSKPKHMLMCKNKLIN